MNKYDIFLTLNEFDYKSIELDLTKLNFDAFPELKINLIKIIQDHKCLVASRDKIVKEQTLQANIFFKMFDEPEINIDSENKEQNPSPIIPSPIIPSPVVPSPIISDDEKKSDGNKKRKNGGKKSLPKGKIIHRNLSDENKKCPCCKNRMHKQTSRVKTRVIAIPILSTETHIQESYRCLSCETVATAEDPYQNQTIGRYHFSAVASIIALRYQYGMASYRMDNMSDVLGIRISDSTQWFLFENAANILKPFISFLEKFSANAPKQHIDDTHNIILDIVKEIEEKQEEALEKGQDPKKIRSGIHTTNLTSVFPEGEIILYKTGLHHSGEILAKILEKRTTEEQIIIMADASSSNTSELDLIQNKNIKIANCNSHAIRKFIEMDGKDKKIASDNKIPNYETSESLDFFITRYKIVFDNDKKTKNITSSERLLFHKSNSLPLMEEMYIRAKNDYDKKIIEPKSDIGKIYYYLLKHFKELTAFCQLENAPICNNLSERMLKSIIRHRKNSLFFKTQIGAAVADILTSILFTAKVNNLNTVEYLRNLLLHQKLWKQNPEDWLPWNFLATISKL